MTWPTDEEREAVRDELAHTTIGAGYYSTAVSIDEARDMADEVLAALAPHVAALVRAERAAALRDARDAYPAMLRDMVSRGSVRRWLDDRADAEERGESA